MYKFSHDSCYLTVMIQILLSHKEKPLKKTHLLTKPTRIQDINFDDLDDGIDTRGTERAERSRIRSYRKLRHQEL